MVVADILLAGVVLIAIVLALVRTGRLGAPRAPRPSPTAERIARIREARDLRLGKRRR